MKNPVIIPIVFMLLMSLTSHASPVVSTFKIRPQGLNGARRAAGEIPGIYPFNYHVQSLYYDEPATQAFLSVTPSYNKSFRPQSIAQSLFGDTLLSHKKDCSIIKVQGSQLPDRDPNAWLADYFYVSDTFDGRLSFSPSITNTVVDFSAYISLDHYYKSLYLKIYAPFVHTRWHLNMREHVISARGIVTGGRFSPENIENELLLSSLSHYFNGNTPPVFSQPGVIGADTNAAYTIIRHPLLVDKISSSKKNDNNTLKGFGEIRAELGIDWWQHENGHIAVYAAGAIPTTHKPKTCFLFFPTIGNGHHWELGGGVSGHWVFWKNEGENQQAGMYADCMITHLFRNKQYRTFDLKNKPLSRYMLAAKHKKLNPAGGENSLGGSSQSLDPVFDCASENDFIPVYVQANAIGDDMVLANYQFDNEFSPVANLTAQKCLVSVNAQIDATIWLNYSINNISIDFGYNLWLQTKDKVSSDRSCSATDCLSLLQNGNWALQGDEQLFGYFDPSIIVAGKQFGSLAAGSKGIAIAASQSQATITNGTNVTTDRAQINAGVDKPLKAFAQTVPLDPLHPKPLVNFAHRDMSVVDTEVFTLLAENSIQLSADPRFIAPQDIDFSPPLKAFSQKLFGNIGYTWWHKHYAPYISIGGEVEIGSLEATRCHGEYTTSSNCITQSVNYAISQWGIWTKIGFIFN